MLLDLGAQHVMNRLEELTPSLLAGVATDSNPNPKPNPNPNPDSNS